jgi:hypothetical protein
MVLWNCGNVGGNLAHFYLIQFVSWYVCACILRQVIFYLSVFCRHRKQTPKTTNQDAGYVMKRQRSVSNPAFMKEEDI